MSQSTTTTQLENLLNMLSPAQFQTLVASLSEKGLSGNIVGADGEVDEATLQVVAGEVWVILEGAE